MTIQSSIATASSYAQNIVTSANTILDASEPTKDSSSSFQGNSLASSYIDQEKAKAESICSQIKAFVANLHSIASEFQAVDERSASTISGASLPYVSDSLIPRQNNTSTPNNSNLPGQTGLLDSSLLPINDSVYNNYSTYQNTSK